MKNTIELKNILIPTDFSETSLLALEHGSNLAKLTKANLHLIHVHKNNWTYFSVIEPQMNIPDISEINKRLERKLEELSENIFKEYGVKPVTQTIEGIPSDEIVSYAKENNIDLIVMGTHGVSGFEEFFIGSNTYKVVTHSDSPVLSVQTHATKVGFEKILLPIDNSQHPFQKVDYAEFIARNYNAEIQILGLMHDFEGSVEEKKIKLLLSHVEKHFKARNIKHSSTISKSTNTAKATMSFAEQNNSDLIMIMTDQDELATGFFLGAYAQQIVNHSKVPVFSITPHEGEYKGFKMPGSNE
jgi:nucleotide-binding universal stress UspA family protein